MEPTTKNTENLNMLLFSIKVFFENEGFTVLTDARTAHQNAQDYLVELKFGDFKCMQQFYLPEWLAYIEIDTITDELKKRLAMVNYWFTSAGYKFEDGGKPHSFDNRKP